MTEDKHECTKTLIFPTGIPIMIKKINNCNLQPEFCEDKENLFIVVYQYMIFRQNFTNVVGFTNPTRKKHSFDDITALLLLSL